MEAWKSADLMLRSEKFLTTGCEKLDVALRGGIARRGITQIYGAAGTGKTQYALQLCLSVQISNENGGCNAGAAYICTESVFPTRRLRQLLVSSELVKKHGASGDKIFVEHVSTIADLESCLLERIPGFLKAQKIGLIVIDSIAAPFRSEYNGEELKSRAKSLRSIGHSLHNLCRNYELSVVCVNQVSGAVDNKNSSNVCNGDLPTLGTTWTGLVTNSYCLIKGHDCRYLYVRESPYLPRKKIPFEIRIIADYRVTDVMTMNAQLMSPSGAWSEQYFRRRLIVSHTTLENQQCRTAFTWLFAKIVVVSAHLTISVFLTRILACAIKNNSIEINFFEHVSLVFMRSSLTCP